jgi:molybdopterin converting factor small subunit
MYRGVKKGTGGMMKVRAEFYSRLKEIIGASALDLSLPENATVNDLFEQLKERHPQLRDFEKSVLFGIGVEFVDRNQPLNEGDTIAIMPPVQGG